MQYACCSHAVPLPAREEVLSGGLLGPKTALLPLEQYHDDFT